MKKCPFCAEEIQDEAIKCKHCGEMLERQAETIRETIQHPKIEEETIKEMHPALRSYHFGWLVAFFFLITGLAPLFMGLKSIYFPSFLIGSFIVVCIIIHSDSILYTITNKRIRTKSGILSSKIDEIDIDHIRNISLRQDFAGQTLKYGNVLISTAGMAGYEIILKNILRPQEIMTLIKDLQSSIEK